LVDTGRGLTRTTLTASAGEIFFQDLPLGKYQPTISASGFERVKVEDMQVEAGRAAAWWWAAATVCAASNPSPFTIQSGVPIFGSSSLPAPPYGVFSIDQNFRTAYVQNFNTNIQHQLSQSTVLQIGYAGSLSRKPPVTLDINQVPLGAGSKTARPYYSEFPTLGAINQVESILPRPTPR
jgi:hypothetical protein